MSEEQRIIIDGYARNPQTATEINPTDFLGIQQGIHIDDMKKVRWETLYESINVFLRKDFLDIFPANLGNYQSTDSILKLGSKELTEKIFGTIFLEDSSGLSKIDILYSKEKAQVISSQTKNNKDVYSLEFFTESGDRFIGLRRQSSDILLNAIFIGTSSIRDSETFCNWFSTPVESSRVEDLKGFSLNNGIEIRKIFFNVENLLTISYEGD